MSTLKVNNLQDLGADAVVTNGVVAKGALPSGSVLQVVSTTKTDTFSTSSTSYVDVTGVTASITPISASSKILVIVTAVLGGSTSATSSHAQVLRGATPVNIGDAAGNRIQSTFSQFSDGSGISTGGWVTGVMGVTAFLDSPATTSSVTYKLQLQARTSGTAFIGRGGRDINDALEARTPTNITLMEIAG